MHIVAFMRGVQVVVVAGNYNIDSSKDLFGIK